MGNQNSSVPYYPCDAECERQKTLTQLKDLYNNAVMDEYIDSYEARQARKEYLTYKLGEEGYYEMEEKTLENIADKHVIKLAEIYEKIVEEIEEQKKIARDNIIAIKNMEELLEKYRISNVKIMDGLDKQEQTLETAERKVWYTNQRMDKVDFYEKYLTLVLKLLLVLAIVFCLYDRKYGSLTVIIIFYLLIMHFS